MNDVGMDTIIFDIDGTLSNPDERLHYILDGQKNWDAFFAEAKNDKPFRDVCLLAELLGDHPLVNQGAIKLWIFSGRPERIRHDTADWLMIHARGLMVKSEGLLLRDDDDHRPDTVIKKEMLDKIRKLGYNPRLVIDDRPTVVSMWRKEGISVLQHVTGAWHNIED